MAKGVRINKARNFAGELYATEAKVNLASSTLNTSITTVSNALTLSAASLTGSTLTIVQSGGGSASVNLDNLSTTPALLSSGSLTGNTVKFIQSGGASATADLSALVTAGNGGVVVNNNAVSLKLNTDAETSKYAAVSNGGLTIKGVDGAVSTASATLQGNINTVSTTLSGMIDDVVASGTVVNGGTAISVTSAGNVYTVNNAMVLKKLASADAGYAATYQLQDGKGNPIAGADKINILKDQLLQSAYTVYGSGAELVNGQVPGKQSSKTATAIYPFLEFDVYASGGTVASPVYIPVTELFHDVVGGNGISVTHTSGGNVVSLANSATFGSPEIEQYTSLTIDKTQFNVTWIGDPEVQDTTYLKISEEGVELGGDAGNIQLAAPNGEISLNADAVTVNGESIATQSDIGNFIASNTDVVTQMGNHGETTEYYTKITATQANGFAATVVNPLDDDKQYELSAHYANGARLGFLNSAGGYSAGVAVGSSGGIPKVDIYADGADAGIDINAVGGGININAESSLNLSGASILANHQQLYTMASAAITMNAAAVTSGGVTEYIGRTTFSSGTIVNIMSSGTIIYPSVEVNAGGTATIEADFGSATTEQWVVTYVKPV